VNIAKVAPEVVLGALQNSGQVLRAVSWQLSGHFTDISQVCIASKRILIPEEIFRPFVDAMIGFTGYLKPGQPEDPSTGLGPVQNKMQYDRVVGFVDDCRKNGYKFATGDETVKRGKGFFVQPTIIENPPLDSRIVQEEPFGKHDMEIRRTTALITSGPIFPVISYKTEEEAIEISNDSNCGLGASVWGKDVERAGRVGSQLEAGTVWINSWGKPDPRGFFSGFKESGIGGEYGIQGLIAYTNAQCTHLWKTEM
jgi:acyl-CoA reductase-like NAD-dependent aldehyde dehydrogenase